MRPPSLTEKKARVSFLVMFAAIAGCGSPNTVRLTETWPEEPRSFDQVTRDWTRGDKLVSDFDAILEVHATFKSPEWRAAYVEKLAAHQSLPAEEREALLEEHKKSAGEYYEFELLVATYQSRENDLQKGERSMWRIVLADDQGNEVTPMQVKRDRRPREVIRALFPVVPDFSEAYVVKFPREARLLGPDATKFSLRVASERGGIKLVWRGK